MFVIRSVTENDLEDLYELSQKVLFINLPRDRKMIQSKIQKSIACLKNSTSKLWDDYYIFALEDLNLKKIVGVSMIHAQHGTPSEPHFYLEVGKEEKFSHTINTGFVHGTLKLGLDYNGPTEIGGLVLHPDYRRHEMKLGKALSYARFLYMGIHPERFKSEVHSELMPPFDSHGRSPLWEALGRRFMNMEYHEADLLSRSNKEFILSLFPSENIYMTLLPAAAKNAVGKVGRDTLPVKKMLESIGFTYINQVDPFDGGPHYRTKLQDIKPVKDLRKYNIRQEQNEEKHVALSFGEDETGAYQIKIHKGEFKDDDLLVSEPIESDHKFCLKL